MCSSGMGRPDVLAYSYPGGGSSVSRYVPFDALKSDDAMSRLSRCRPVSGFRPSHCEDGIIRFAHNTGDSWWLKLFSRGECLTFWVALSRARVVLSTGGQLPLSRPHAAGLDFGLHPE